MATTSKPATARKPNAAFMKPLTPSAELAAVIGSEAVPRTEVTKKIWEYIKKHNLQDASNKRNINADAKLRPIFGKDQVTMFELTKLVNAHLEVSRLRAYGVRPASCHCDAQALVRAHRSHSAGGSSPGSIPALRAIMQASTFRV